MLRQAQHERVGDPRLHILTLAELFQGKRPNIPLMEQHSGKRARREDMDAGKQGSFL